MILHALHDYYQRRQADPDPARRLPEFGREQKEIGFILELSEAGQLIGITDVRKQVGNKKVGTSYLVPKSVKKTSGVAANLFWDNAEYVLRAPDEKKLAAAIAKGKSSAYLTRLAEMQSKFKERVLELPDSALSDAGTVAVLNFLDTNTLASARQFECFSEIATTNPVVTFRLTGDDSLICQRPGVSPFLPDTESEAYIDADIETEISPDSDSQAYIDIEDEAAANEDTVSGKSGAISSLCLITGNQAPAERLHTVIKGIWGAKSTGANIVSFNLEAFNSFGKTQGANAPVSREAAFAYTTALNSLLAKGSRQRMQVGDASTVFWAQRPDPMEDWLAEIIGGDDPDAHTTQVKALFDAVHTGVFDGARGENKFFLLGLAPNAARVSVRFWHTAPLREVACQIRTWFDDLEISRADFDRPHPSLGRLLSSICLPTREKPRGDQSRLPPKVSGDLLRAIFGGEELPPLMLMAVLQRCRAEQAKKDELTGKPIRHVSAIRAAILKAYINRSNRVHTPNQKEIDVSLDKSNALPAYLLGRLFAVFERVQELAAGRELNRTIRDSYFGAAMTSPQSVYSRLTQLNQIHLRDLKRASPRAGVYFDRLILEIADKQSPATGCPARAMPKDQGIFALGYYHQRQDLFARRDSKADTTVNIAQGGN